VRSGSSIAARSHRRMDGTGIAVNPQNAGLAGSVRLRLEIAFLITPLVPL